MNESEPKGGSSRDLGDGQPPAAAENPQQAFDGQRAVLNEVAPVSPGVGRGAIGKVVESFESVLSVVFFLAMFVVIVIGVFFRYFLNSPLTWTVAVASSLFIWATMVTAGLPHWNDEHIQFDIVYLRFSPAGRRWARIIGNLIIIVPALLVIPASFQYLDFINPQKLSGIELSETWAFAGIAYFFVTTVLHRSRLLVKDLIGLRTSGRERAEGSS